MNPNPFGIGPAGAVFLTVFVCLTVLGTASIWCYTTWLCVKVICQTIEAAWQDLDQLARDLAPMKAGLLRALTDKGA